MAKTPNKSKARILLAEDDRFLSKALSYKLFRSGFDVLLANDGIEAIDKLKTREFDLVLLDVIMPYKDGFEVLREVKGDQRLKNVPIVMMSNFGKTSEMIKGQELGMSDYIVKSDLSLDMMVKKIEELLKQKVAP